MKTIEKIRQKIEELYDGEAPTHAQQCDFDDGYFTGIGAISKFLDSLESEKPMEQEGLEEEMDEFFETMPVFEHENIFEDTFKNIARHFAEWQKNQIMKEVVEADVNIYRDFAEGESWAVFVVAKPPKNLGDKVRIIIIKED